MGRAVTRRVPEPAVGVVPVGPVVRNEPDGAVQGRSPLARRGQDRAQGTEPSLSVLTRTTARTVVDEDLDEVPEWLWESRGVRDDRLWGVRAMREVFAGTDEARLCRCGHLLGRDVEFADLGGRRVVSGVESCAWSTGCPRCRVPVAMRRATLAGVAVARWLARGGSAYFLSVALPHRAEDDLDWLLWRLLDGWRHATRGHYWRLWAKRFGLRGRVRVVEITTSRRGWHPHLHVLVLVDGRDRDPEAEWQLQHDLGQLVYNTMFEHMDRTGTLRPDEFWSPVEGVDVEPCYDPVGAALYMASVSVGDMVGVGLEMSDPGGKTGKGWGSYSAHELAVALGRRMRHAGTGLRDLVEHDLEARWLRDRLRELRAGTKGVRMWQPTPGLFRELVPELVDDLADTDLVERARELWGEDRDLWQQVLAEIAGLTARPDLVDAGVSTDTPGEPGPFDDDQPAGIPESIGSDLPMPDADLVVRRDATVRIAPDVAWLIREHVHRGGGEWMSHVCRAIEQTGPLTAARRIAEQWNHDGGRRARVWAALDGKTVRVGTGAEDWWSPSPDEWTEVALDRAEGPGGACERTWAR